MMVLSWEMEEYKMRRTIKKIDQNVLKAQYQVIYKKLTIRMGGSCRSNRIIKKKMQ